MGSDRALGLPLPVLFSYERRGLWIGGFLITTTSVTLGFWGCLSSGSDAHLSGALFLLLGLVIGLASANIMLFTSNIVLDESGISWSLLGWKWRFVAWPSISEIRIQTFSTYDARGIIRKYTLIETGRSRFYKPIFTEDIQDFGQLKLIFNYYIERYSIVVFSEMGDTKNITTSI